MEAPCSLVNKLLVIVQEGANVDDLVVFSACTSIAVAIADWMVLSRTRPYRLLCALVLLLSACAGSLHFASVTSLRLVCLFIYLLCGTCHMLCWSQYFRTVKQSDVPRVYVKNLLSCLSCLAFTVLLEWSKATQLTHITQQSGLLLALSCIILFLSSYYSCETQATAKTVAGFAAVTSCSKLISLVINYLVWDQHRLPWANMLLAGIVLAGQMSLETNRQSSQPKHQRSNSKACEVTQNPAETLAGILAVAAAIAAVLWVGVILGATVTR